MISISGVEVEKIIGYELTVDDLDIGDAVEDRRRPRLSETLRHSSFKLLSPN